MAEKFGKKIKQYIQFFIKDTNLCPYPYIFVDASTFHCLNANSPKKIVYKYV